MPRINGQEGPSRQDASSHAKDFESSQRLQQDHNVNMIQACTESLSHDIELGAGARDGPVSGAMSIFKLAIWIGLGLVVIFGAAAALGVFFGTRQS
jgi:hypothetical protein